MKRNEELRIFRVKALGVENHIRKLFKASCMAVGISEDMDFIRSRIGRDAMHLFSHWTINGLGYSGSFSGVFWELIRQPYFVQRRKEESLLTMLSFRCLRILPM